MSRKLFIICQRKKSKASLICQLSTKKIYRLSTCNNNNNNNNNNLTLLLHAFNEMIKRALDDFYL